MAVADELHFPNALLLGKGPTVPTEQVAGWAQKSI
jgi:hypothetical protein